jgi:Sugar-transfer associated ATP-grasp
MNKPELDVLSVAEATALRKRLGAPPKLELAANVRAAANASGGHFLQRLLKVVGGFGKLTAHEYFYYRLYHPSLSEAALDRFVGKKIQNRMHAACNDVRWFAACHDKLLWSAILTGASLPVPDTVALFGKMGRFGASRSLRSKDELSRFITDPSNHPLFCKPVDGINSLGAIRIEGIKGEELIINGGYQRRIGDVVHFISSLSPAGYLLQKVLPPSPLLAPITGSAISSIRFLVLLTGTGPAVESAVIKLPTKDQVADNFWRSGNMLAAIDLASGTITRAVAGVGSDLKVIEREPASGINLPGFTVPDFQAAQALILQAAVYFSGIRTQSWDVALTADGPVLLEMNFGGDLNLHQLAHNRGVLSDAYCRHVRACGYKRRLPAFEAA